MTDICPLGLWSMEVCLSRSAPPPFILLLLLLIRGLGCTCACDDSWQCLEATQFWSAPDFWCRPCAPACRACSLDTPRRPFCRARKLSRHFWPFLETAQEWHCQAFVVSTPTLCCPVEGDRSCYQRTQQCAVVSAALPW